MTMNELPSDAYICGPCPQSHSSSVSVFVTKSQISNQVHHQAVSFKHYTVKIDYMITHTNKHVVFLTS